MSSKIAKTPTYAYNLALSHLESTIEVSETGYPIKG